MEALNARKTTRVFSQRTLSDQQLSNLLWAADGINREDGRRTAPTAVNTQEIDIYVYTAQRVYLYMPQSHSLKPVAEGDFRGEVFTQPALAACPVALVYVANYDRMQRFNDEKRAFYGATDTGFVSQNVYLFCASEGLNTVVAGAICREKIRARLKFNGKAVLAQPVGYGK